MKKLPFEKPKKKKTTIKRLKFLAWDYFAKVQRTKGVEADGQIKCITCHRRYPVGDRAWNAGHFKHGKFSKQSGFYENNVWPQCVFCNCGGGKNGGGDLITALYERALIEKLGLAEVENIKERSMQIWKPTREELEGIVSEYKSKLEGLNQ